MTIEASALLERAAARPTSPLAVRAAIADYDRTRRILDGRIKPRGVDLTVTDLHVGDFCTRPVYEEYDLAEMSFSWYVAAKDRGEPVIALPIFPLRVAVLAYVLVRKGSPFYVPSDLIGRRVGTSAYRMTVNLWLRGIFSEHYGLRPDQVDWVTCEPEGPAYSIPSGINCRLASGKTPEQLLDSGEVDALFLPVLPKSLVEGGPKFRHLFMDPQREMHTHFQRTGFVPITHLVVLNQSLSERHEWLTESLFRAFQESQRQCEAFWFGDEKRLSFPDAIFLLEQHYAAYGRNTYTQGIASNRPALEAFIRYAFEQGYTSRLLALQELFSPQSLSL